MNQTIKVLYGYIEEKVRRKAPLIIVIFLSLFSSSALSAERELKFSYSPNWIYGFTAKASLSIDRSGKVKLKVEDVSPKLPQAYIWMKFYPKIENVFWYNRCIYVDFSIKFQGQGRAVEIPFKTTSDVSTYRWDGPQKGLHEEEWNENSVEGKPHFCTDEFPELSGIKHFQTVQCGPNTFSFQVSETPESHQQQGEFPDRTFIKRKKGEIYVYRAKTHKWFKARRGFKLYVGDIVKTTSGAAEIVLAGTALVKIKPHTMFQIPKIKANTEKHISFIKLTYGVIMAEAIREKNRLKVAVPQAILGVRGTKFEVSYDKSKKLGCVRVFEHSVWFSDEKKRKTVIVNEGMESCVVGKGVPSEPRPMKPLKIRGKWNSNFGLITFKQKGNRVEGAYTHDKGKIEGTLTGNVLICRWSEAPTYKPQHDAGDCRLRFSPEGDSFTGSWRYGFGGNSWKGKWTGKRVN